MGKTAAPVPRYRHRGQRGQSGLRVANALTAWDSGEHISEKAACRCREANKPRQGNCFLSALEGARFQWQCSEASPSDITAKPWIQVMSTPARLQARSWENLSTSRSEGHKSSDSSTCLCRPALLPLTHRLRNRHPHSHPPAGSLLPLSLCLNQEPPDLSQSRDRQRVVGPAPG